MPNRVLYLDLSEKESEIVERPDIFDKHLGGIGAAIKLFEESPAGGDPLSPEAPIIFAIGPLNTYYPCCCKVVSVFKSPLTGNLGESHAGGRLGFVMRLADYDAIVIKGASPNPTYIAIHDEEISFKDATSLWGISVYSTGRVLRQVEPGSGRRSILRIGMAGERRVRFANVNVDVYRHFGRLGLGAVFGSKGLKAIVISGSKSFQLKRSSQYNEIYGKLYREITESSAMKKYHDVGTAENVLVLNEIGALPTKNFSRSRFDGAAEISGERFAETHLVRKTACTGCPIGCIHIATLRIQFAEGYEYGSLLVPYDYQPIYALGPMLGIDSIPNVLRLIEKIDRYGLDVISGGVALAWATEAFQRGLISERDTFGLKLKWGDADVYAKMIDLIITTPTKFYKILGRGVEVAASKYGGLDFAMSLGKNEVAGYHTGPANLLGQLLGCRHSHLDNAGYSIDQKGIEEEAIVDSLIKEEQWRNVLASLVACFFARGIYKEDFVEQALSAVGIDRTAEELKALGKEIYKLKYKIKLREGFSFEGLGIPKRFFELTTPRGLLEEQHLKGMLENYKSKIEQLLKS